VSGPGYSRFVQTKTEGGTTEVFSGVKEKGYTEVEYTKIKETMPLEKELEKSKSETSGTMPQYSASETH